MGSRKIIKHYFNMIEILLAIGILTVGFSSVLGLFPVAVKIVRNSQTEGVVSDAVGDLQSYFYSMAHAPLNDPTPSSGEVEQMDGEYWYGLMFYDNVSDFTDPLITTKYNLANYSVFLKDGTGINSINELRTKLIDGEPNDSTDKWNGQEFLVELRNKVDSLGENAVRDGLVADASFGLKRGLNLFQPNPRKTYFYLIKGDEDYRNIELTAQILVWKSYMNELNTVTQWGHYKHGVVLNVEVSWPISSPYFEREKRYYQFSIANPKLKL